MKVDNTALFIPHPSGLKPLLRFFVSRVLTAASAKLTEFESLRRRLLVFSGRIITTLTIRALKYYIVARHNLPFETLRFLISDFGFRSLGFGLGRT